MILIIITIFSAAVLVKLTKQEKVKIIPYFVLLFLLSVSLLQGYYLKDQHKLQSPGITTEEARTIITKHKSRANNFWLCFFHSDKIANMDIEGLD